MQRTVLGIIFILVTTYLSAQSGSVLLKIEGVKTVDGKIQIGLYNSAEGFPNFEENFAVGVAKPNTKETTFVFDNVDPGTYVIALWHDENNDEELNKNMFGIPKEKYGFSNNATGTFGPPKFKDASFVIVAEEKTVLRIKLK